MDLTSAGVNDRSLEARWQTLRTRVETFASLLETQGVLTPRRDGGRIYWYLRFVEIDKGRSIRRSLYVGTHPELIRRVGKLLEECRERHRWMKETSMLARLALGLGTSLFRALPCGRRPRAGRRPSRNE
jgi:hypothetical protein